MHLDIQIGEHAQDYAQVMARDKLTELQLRVRQLLDQVEQVTKEQNYQRVSFLEPEDMHPDGPHRGRYQEGEGGAWGKGRIRLLDG